MSQRKLNCWEFKKCGRQPGGNKTKELGVCPAATDKRLHGVHGGRNAGRACWVLAGTLCHGVVQGIFAQKLANCHKCDFYIAVIREEDRDFRYAKELLGLLEDDTR